MVCEDGIVRYPLMKVEKLVKSPPLPGLPRGRLRKGETITNPLTRDDLDRFEKIWRDLYLYYFGVSAPFLGKKFLNKYKVWAVSRVMRNVYTDEDLRLFLKSQFEAARSDRRYLSLNRLGGPESMRFYQNWLTRFPRKEDALRNATPMSVEDRLFRDHGNYLGYKRMLWPDRVIFRTRYREFSHFYLFASEEFSEFWAEESTIPETFRETHGELWHELARDPATLEDFWNLVRTVKCKVEQDNLISAFR